MEVPDIPGKELDVLATENDRATHTRSEILLPLQQPPLNKSAPKANEKTLDIHKHSVVSMRLSYDLFTLRLTLATKSPPDLVVRSGVYKNIPYGFFRDTEMHTAENTMTSCPRPETIKVISQTPAGKSKGRPSSEHHTFWNSRAGICGMM